MAYTMGDRESRGENSTITVGQFFRVLFRRRVSFLITFLICLVVAAAGYEVAGRTYQAVARINITPDPTTGVDPKSVSTETESRVLTSTEVAELAKEQLHSQAPPDTLLNNVSVSAPLNSLVLNVTYTAPTADAAAAGANAFAHAYVTYKSTVGHANLTNKSNGIKRQIDDLTTRLDALPASSTQRSALQSQILNLQTQLNSVVGTVVFTGQVIGRATPPSSASSPRLTVYGGGGIAVGLLLAVIVAVFRDRRDDSVRTVDDVERAVGAPTLAVLPFNPRASRRVDSLATLDNPLTAQADAFRTLALKLVKPAAKPAGRAVRSRARTGEERPAPAVVIALLGVDASGRSALDLAVALARQRVRTALVSIAGPAAAARSTLERAGSKAPANLSVVSAGDELELDGVLRSPDSPLLKAHKDAEVILLDGVSVEHASTALSLAQYADGCLVFATVGVTTKATLRAIAQELSQIGAYISGTALLYRARRTRASGTVGAGASAVGGPSTAKATQYGRPIIADDLEEQEPAADDHEGGSARARVDKALRRREPTGHGSGSSQ